MGCDLNTASCITDGLSNKKRKEKANKYYPYFIWQNTGQDEGASGEAGKREGVCWDPGRGQPHLQLRRGAHLRWHRVPGLIGGQQQQHWSLQPPVPSPSEPAELPYSLEPCGQRSPCGSRLRSGQQTTQRAPRCSRQVGLHPHFLFMQMTPTTVALQLIYNAWAMVALFLFSFTCQGVTYALQINNEFHAMICRCLVPQVPCSSKQNQQSRWNNKSLAVIPCILECNTRQELLFLFI